jgi:glycosyltransferase involved in cell wall biosynthesis
LTQFAKKKFIESGLPAERIAVKPNFVRDQRYSPTASREGALYVGRLSSEKGIQTMLDAWHESPMPLTIIGDGPLISLVANNAAKNIHILGRRSTDEVAIAMRNASLLVMPSLWYEGFALVLAEAFSHGLPVIASRLGAMEEIVNDGITGLHFEPGNSDDLALKVKWASNHPGEMQTMGEAARRNYEEKYTPVQNYRILKSIYERSIQESTGPDRAANNNSFF